MSLVKKRPCSGQTIESVEHYNNNEQNEDFNSKLNEKNCSKKENTSTSMSSLWHEFKENTSMHGLKHARWENKFHIRWVIWILALLAMGSLLVYTVFSLLGYYSTNPTLTNINVQFAQDLMYPAVTICNLSPYKSSTINASDHMRTHLLHASRLGVILPPLNYSDPVYSELQKPIGEDWLDKVSFDLDDMFHFCVNKRHVIPCKTILTPKLTQWGKCFTFNNYDKVQSSGRENGSTTGSATALTFYLHIQHMEYVLSTNMAAGVKVVLHEPEEEPDVNNKGFILSPGTSNYVSMEMTKYKYLPAPYKADGDRYCLDTTASDYDHVLQYYPFYSSTGCLLECRRNFIVGKCGCRAVTDPGNETLCSPAESATCYYQHEVIFDSSGDLKGKCKCMIPCQFTTFEHSISTASFPADVYVPALQQMGYTDIKNNLIEVRLYFDSLSYLLVESIPEYNTEDIVGILGGQMGIFLGASLLTISELLEFVILSLISVVKRCWMSLPCKRRKISDEEQTPNDKDYEQPVTY